MGESWAIEGDRLKADPHSIRGYGKNIATLRKNFADDVNGPALQIQGAGDDASISTGGFAEGGQAQELCTRNAIEMGMFLQDCSQDLTAFASVALIVADLLEKADLDNAAALNAVEWAMAVPGSDKPANLPAYLKEGTTLEDRMKEAGTEGAVNTAGDKLIASYSPSPGVWHNTYQTSDGGTRSVVQTADGYTEVGYNAKGEMLYQVQAAPDGSSTSKTYNEGKLVAITERATVVNSVQTTGQEHKQVITKQYDAEHKLQSETVDHTVTTAANDGTGNLIKDKYTTDEDGTVTNPSTVGAQPRAVTADDWIDLTDMRLEETRHQVGGL